MKSSFFFLAILLVAAVSCTKYEAAPKPVGEKNEWAQADGASRIALLQRLVDSGQGTPTDKEMLGQMKEDQAIDDEGIAFPEEDFAPSGE